MLWSVIVIVVLGRPVITQSSSAQAETRPSPLTIAFAVVQTVILDGSSGFPSGRGGVHFTGAIVIIRLTAGQLQGAV